MKEEAQMFLTDSQDLDTTMDNMIRRANEEIQQIFVSLQNTVRARPTMVYEPSSSWIVQT